PLSPSNPPGTPSASCSFNVRLRPHPVPASPPLVMPGGSRPVRDEDVRGWYVSLEDHFLGNPSEESCAIAGGESLGGCRIIGLIGRGGRGAVYEALHVALDRK